MAIEKDTREMANIAITVEIPGLDPCAIQEFSWMDLFRVRELARGMGLDSINIDPVPADAASHEVERVALDNMIRMIATATVAIQRTMPAVTFDMVADLFRPRDDQMMDILTRVVSITSDGTEPSPVAETSGNGLPGQEE